MLKRVGDNSPSSDPVTNNSGRGKSCFSTRTHAMIINGDGGHGLLAAYIGGPAAAIGLVPMSAATWRRFCIHRVN